MNSAAINSTNNFQASDFNIYNPSQSLRAKLDRRLVRYRKREVLNIRTEKPIVSFSFDDCPQSVFLNALPAMEERNWRGTIYAAMGLCETTNHLGRHMSRTEMQHAHQAGHEIADHTYSHLDANQVSLDEFQRDIDKNKAAFQALGLPPARSFAYPYGEVNFAAKSVLSERFDLLRGIHSPKQTHALDLNQAASQRLYSGADFVACRQAIRALKSKPSWLILFTHDVRKSPSEFGCTPKDFQAILDDVEAIGAEVLPVSEALDAVESHNAFAENLKSKNFKGEYFKGDTLQDNKWQEDQS
ncbi:peptidoglycan/xylan/chitin deacetylase (PgdA/CDA1 family) [Litorimonas taeanensis]|uniref:Chitooligosaccharide deacetylase n=1 Tax=Litorimonas taeanensis TaxID=568099 RepID=A0A420WLZ5_9PROT|nr:polysaccharide deacetylase family protein [Litorimonas taeanensis]RKQ71905.1 peptidoglycan/xylan/chitin deacetylase (PgdA/CDA1 family) [Litorimonas taeanensis]